MEIIEQRLGQQPGSADRAPWLLLHGAYQDASQWTAFQEAADGAGVATRALSLPGHGTSTLHKGELRFYSVRDYVRIVLAEVERAEPKPLLVGVGLGAWLALRVAEECAVPGLVLFDPPSPRGAYGHAAKTFLRHPLWSLRHLRNGFEDPWREASGVANELLGGVPPGRESSCVLRELFDRPVANFERVEAPVLVLGRAHAAYARWTRGGEPYERGDLASADRCAALVGAVGEWAGSRV